ncbi:hypothetical protein SCHPADRAFT_1002179 [Schizopora paradoxa]|uniref:F-box domain-containing protein n=1 Tax=Schizopora paradoxa TaxID=27342 RepID=A0A0H2RB15_9AGAM|nr:hypothetical protein SCHPADRAFT_1002179 [Schizopora paradoxa]
MPLLNSSKWTRRNMDDQWTMLSTQLQRSPVDSLSRSYPTSLQYVTSQYHRDKRPGTYLMVIREYLARRREARDQMLVNRVLSLSTSANVKSSTTKFVHSCQPTGRLQESKTTILHLPYEVLANIVDSAILASCHSDTANVALFFSHVSKKFRRAVHDRSCFWPHVSTDMPYDQIKHLLEKNLMSLRHLNVECKSLCKSRTLFDMASLQSSLWGSLFLMIGAANGVPNSNLSLLRRLYELEVPELKRLTLAYADPDTVGANTLNDFIHPNNLIAPNLDHLELMNIIPRHAFSSISRLTLLFDPGWQDRRNEYRIFPLLNWESVLDFLRISTTVKDLTLDLRVMSGFAAETRDTPTLLPHVTSFTARLEDIHIYTPLWTELLHFSLPNLQNLEIQIAMLRWSPKYRGVALDEERERIKSDDFLQHLFAANGGYFANVTDLSVKLDIRIPAIKNDFHLPFHKFPNLKRLHVQSNRNIFPPNSHHLKLMPNFRLRLRCLELVNCTKMNNFAWMRRLATHISPEDLEAVVIVTDNDFPSRKPLLEFATKIFGKTKIRLEEHVAERIVASSPFDSAFR